MLGQTGDAVTSKAFPAMFLGREEHSLRTISESNHSRQGWMNVGLVLQRLENVHLGKRRRKHSGNVSPLSRLCSPFLKSTRRDGKLAIIYNRTLSFYFSPPLCIVITGSQVCPDLCLNDCQSVFDVEYLAKNWVMDIN